MNRISVLGFMDTSMHSLAADGTQDTRNRQKSQVLWHVSQVDDRTVSNRQNFDLAACIYCAPILYVLYWVTVDQGADLPPGSQQGAFGLQTTSNATALLIGHADLTMPLQHIPKTKFTTPLALCR